MAYCAAGDFWAVCGAGRVAEKSIRKSVAAGGSAGGAGEAECAAAVADERLISIERAEFAAELQ